MTGWSMGIEGWLWMGAWILALIVAVALLAWNPRRDRDRDEPLDILRGRLARGEISPDEYQRARGLLEDSPTRTSPIDPSSDRKAHR